MSIRFASTNRASSSDLRNNISKSIRVLVIAGGAGPLNGASGSTGRGGGGAGGMLEQTLTITTGTNYPVSVGAGGSSNGSFGSSSRFDSVICIGGGYQDANGTFLRGGSNGGGLVGNVALVGTVATQQGNIGGNGNGNQRGGGGGGAGGVGSAATASAGGNGGIGRSSTIPVNTTTYAAGGGGGGNTGNAGGTGGSSIGGNGGSSTVAATNGAVNTGSGGGGGGGTAGFTTAGTGGSGIIIIRFNSSLRISIGAGLTSTTETSGSDTIVTFTAGTDNVSFN